MLQEIDALAKGESVRVGYMEKLQLIKNDWDKLTYKNLGNDHDKARCVPGSKARWADLDSNDDCDGVGDASS